LRAAASSGIDDPLGIPSCTATAGGIAPERIVTISARVPVAAGNHGVYLLGRKDGGSRDPTFSDRTLSVLFVDRGFLGRELAGSWWSPLPNERRGEAGSYHEPAS
jgi:hypothetical protein